METRLWAYIDGLSNEQERSFVAKLIQENQEWNNKYHELLDVHQLIQQNMELDEPSMRFTQNVMDVIASEQIAPAASSYIKKSVIRSIAAFFLISIGALLVYTLAKLDWAAAGKSVSTTQLPNMDVSKFMSPVLFNSMAIVTVVLALALIDTAIRRKQKRNRKMTHH